jgi:hypothetical protein
MNDEKWQDLKEKISTRFGNLEIEVEKSEMQDDLGHSLPVTTESLIFDSPLGEIKISRESHAKIVDKKAHYHKGAGGADIEFVVDDTEKSNRLTVYKRDHLGNWELFELPPEKFNF